MGEGVKSTTYIRAKTESDHKEGRSHDQRPVFCCRYDFKPVDGSNGVEFISTFEFLILKY